jgi:hypothetical protein
MDRIIVYPGAIPLDTDMLNTNDNVMVALHALISATLGTNTAVDGLAVSATVPASMQITVAPGSITQYGVLDATPYGSRPADLTDPLVKMANLLDPQAFTLTAPSVAGSSMVYLVEASFSEIDQVPVVLPYYNAANPAMPYLGPGNSGAAQMTVRQQHVQVQVKAGTPVTSGSPGVPPVDPGWIALAVIPLNAGATQVPQSTIFTAPTTRFTPWKLPDLTPGFAFSQAFSSSGTFVVPNTVTRLRATAIGGGGAGGSCTTGASVGAGGGGAGGVGKVWLTNMTPGSLIPVTVGAFGVAIAGSTGGAGSTSSFGTYCSATGGAGGLPGSSSASGTGGIGGNALGATVYYPGSYGSDAVPGVARGGDGGGPGGGKGSSSGANGANAVSWGGGGGGASGAGFSGGSGGGGLVIVEW